MYIARNIYNQLMIFNSVPVRTNDDLYSGDGNFLDSSLCPNLKWEDEPIEVFKNIDYRNIVDKINHIWALLKCTQDDKLDETHHTLEKIEKIYKFIYDKKS